MRGSSPPEWQRAAGAFTVTAVSEETAFGRLAEAGQPPRLNFVKAENSADFGDPQPAALINAAATHTCRCVIRMVVNPDILICVSTRRIRAVAEV